MRFIGNKTQLLDNTLDSLHRIYFKLSLQAF